MRVEQIQLNNGGYSDENPLISGMVHHASLHKHNSDETLKHCWVSVGSTIYSNLTSRCVTTDEEISVKITEGTDSSAGSPLSIKNVIHFTTTEGHYKGDFYVLQRPPIMITLDGYNAENMGEPLIYPVYVAGGG